MDPTESVSGLTAFSFLGIGGLLALPVFVLPVVLFGAPVASGLSDAAWIGAIGFVLFTGVRRGGHGHRRPRCCGPAGPPRPCRNRVAEEAATASRACPSG